MSKKKARTTSRSSALPARWIVFAILLAVTLVSYWNSFGVPFVFDDLATIQRNTTVRFGEFGWNLLAARSVLYLTFSLNHIWAGQEVWYYHLINFLMHLLNGLLVFLLAEQVFRHIENDRRRCRIYAGLAAAFFLVHPIQTESVTYVSSRSELLSTLFYLAGFLIYTYWPRHRIGFLCSIAVAVPYFFGLGSKETVITLPATIFLYDFLFLSNAEFRNVLSRWRFYLVFVLGAVGAIYYLLTVSLRQTVGEGLPGNLTAWNYLLTQLRVITHYVRLIVVPIGLNLDYDFRHSTSPLEVSVIASFLFLCGLAFLGWRLRRSAPVFSFSILWFFVTLSPTSSVVPIADVIFEHRLYLPLVGVCLSFPFFMDWAYSKLRERFSIPGNASGYASIVLVALLAGTIYRNYVWSDEVRLFTDVVSKSPNKSRPLNGLAWAYYKRADYVHAIDVLEKGFPKLSVDGKKELTDTLANMYLKVGRYDSAIDLFNKSTKYFTGPLLAQEYNNIGVTYLYMWNDLQSRQAQMSSEEYARRIEEILKPASEAFLKGLEIEPDMPWALDAYVNATFYRGKGDELSAAASDRLKQKENFDDLYTVGKLAFHVGDFAKADQYFERAEKLRNDVKILFFNHGYALTQLQQDDRAIIKYIESIRIDPIFIEAHHNLGLIYMRQSNYPKAAEAFAEVLRLDPKHLSSNLNLAAIYMSQGNKAEARSHLLTVLEASPGNQQAATMLAQLGS